MTKRIEITGWPKNWFVYVGNEEAFKKYGPFKTRAEAQKFSIEQEG